MDRLEKKLALLGASGHGKVAADAALTEGWSEVVFFDDAWPNVRSNGRWPVVGDTADLMKRLSEFDGVLVSIGNCRIRMQKQEELIAARATVPVIVHPRAWVSPHASLGLGTIVMAGAIVNADAKIGVACIINTGATVDHDCDLADGVHISPGAHLSGNVSVGFRSWVGVGVAVRQGINIGADAMIGAGAVVVKTVENGTTVVGNPASLLEKR